jgi:hypothetical protein
MSKSYFRPLTIYHTVTAAEDTANKAVLDVASGTALYKTTDAFWFIGQVKSADVDIPGFKYTYSTTTGLLTVADAGAVALTSGDLITVMGIFVS